MAGGDILAEAGSANKDFVRPAARRL